VLVIESENVRVHQGDCLSVLRALPDSIVQCCVTSPPYWGLRDYGVGGQLGLEKTPGEYVANMVAVFREVRRVLRDDGTLWLNLGDSYGKQKQLAGIPWRVAFALQADGWILRQDVIWHKPSPMPESVSDRCTKAHEYLFLLAKSPRYFFDAEAIKEAQQGPIRSRRFCATGGAEARAVGRKLSGNEGAKAVWTDSGKRNRRSVWQIASKPYKGAHFACFPPALVEPCILAGSAPGDTVLDPFMGSGTTAQVALEHDRKALGIELNADYIELIKQRLAKQAAA
jgi:DNA modification methylase